MQTHKDLLMGCLQAIIRVPVLSVQLMLGACL